jgi:hypothetical protein
MIVGSQDNAMAEIALALAMAFFSIMVLTMVSMSAESLYASSDVPLSDKGLSLSPTAFSHEEMAKPAATPVETLSGDSIIIHYQDRFFNGRLEPIDISGVTKPGPWVLAVAPDVSLAKTTEIRAQVPSSNVTVTILDKRWLNTMKGFER